MATFHAKMAAKILQTCWRGKGTGTPLPDPVPPPSGTPPPPGTQPVLPCDTDWNESYEVEGMPSMCVYIHSPLPNTQLVNHTAYAKHSKHNKQFIPDFVSTLSAVWKYHWHWIWRWVQPFQWIGQWRWGLIESNGICEYYHYLQFVDTLQYILKIIFICTIKEQCSDTGKRTWRG
jgi:hypothetical protein